MKSVSRPCVKGSQTVLNGPTSFNKGLATSLPLNNGHIGGKAVIHCREVVPILEVGWPATPLNPEVVNEFLIQRGVACKHLNRQSRTDTLN